MPSRGDIDPSDIKELLPYILIADLLADPVRVRYRLAGTKICETFGFDITGRWLHDFHGMSNVPFWVAQYARMLALRDPVYGRTTGTHRNVEVFRADWALLPLSADGLQVDQALEIEDWTKGSPIARFDDDTIVWRDIAFE
jgi:hypothetical protein